MHHVFHFKAMYTNHNGYGLTLIIIKMFFKSRLFIENKHHFSKWTAFNCKKLFGGGDSLTVAAPFNSSRPSGAYMR